MHSLPQRACLGSLIPALLVPALSAAPQGGCGSGGPGGDFDWVIPAGTTLIIDTTMDVIVGGPDGQPTTTQTVIGGVIEVNDMRVEAGATLLFQGPNPGTILATGNVDIDGHISLDGQNSFGVATLNTANVPELGAPGTAGGGGGGIGSFLTNQSTPQGGRGQGAFGATDGGGEGGETGFSPMGKNARRGAGGGGGRFGSDIFVERQGVRLPGQNLIGMDAEGGFAGGADGLGAMSQNRRARGGDVGPSPFQNARPGDDFLGTLITPDGTVIQGELPALWAGAGGGAGGDAVNSTSFPLVPFSANGDEKGAGGGGGAGALMILAEGDLRVGLDGSITADGGHGGGGENTTFFDRVGGGSGGGSGGHIVLQAEGEMIFEGFTEGAGEFYEDDASLLQRARPISALGGQGGAGRDNRGGAQVDGPTLWRCDAIPFDAFELGVVTEPLDENCFQALDGVGTSTDLFDWADPNNVAQSGAGGDGSPGLIQLHVGSTDDFVFPAAIGGDLTKVFVPAPVGWSDGRFRGRLEADLCSALPLTWGGNLLNPLSLESEPSGSGGAWEVDSLLHVDFQQR